MYNVHSHPEIIGSILRLNRAGQELSRFQCLLLIRKMLLHHRIYICQRLFHQRSKQIILILKEKIQRSGGHSGILTDASQRCLHKSLLQKFLHRTLLKLFPGFLLIIHSCLFLLITNITPLCYHSSFFLSSIF